MVSRSRPMYDYIQMAIDDPIDQARALIASDEAQHSPVGSIGVKLLKLINSTPVLKDMLSGVTKPLEIIMETLQRWRTENVSYLLEVVTQEVQRLNREVSSLSLAHQEFIGEEWLKLVVDGMAKAQQTRAKERVRRMGRVLAHAFEKGEKLSPDTTEEMLRVAMSLDENDVTVLEWLCERMKSGFNAKTGRVDHETVNDVWGLVDQGRTRPQDEHETPAGLSTGDVTSACAKLQSFGLVVQVRQNSAKVSPATLPFGPLNKGYEFLNYVRSSK
jgi:hypothetical protein